MITKLIFNAALLSIACGLATLVWVKVVKAWKDLTSGNSSENVRNDL